MNHSSGCRCPACHEAQYESAPRPTVGGNREFSVSRLVAWLNSKCVAAAKSGDDKTMRQRADESSLVEKLATEMMGEQDL